MEDLNKKMIKDCVLKLYKGCRYEELMEDYPEHLLSFAAEITEMINWDNFLRKIKVEKMNSTFAEKLSGSTNLQ